MRLLFALLALLSGLSVPQAVAAASAGRVDSSLVASEAAPADNVQQACVVRRALLHPRGVDCMARSTRTATVSALFPQRDQHFGDRARE